MGTNVVESRHPPLTFDITNMTYEEYLDRFHRMNFAMYQEMLAKQQMDFMMGGPMAMMGMGPMHGMGMPMGGRGFRGGRGRGGRY